MKIPQSFESTDEAYEMAMTSDADYNRLMQELVRMRRTIFCLLILMALTASWIIMRSTFMPMFKDEDPLSPSFAIAFSAFFYCYAMWFSFDTRIKLLKALHGLHNGSHKFS